MSRSIIRSLNQVTGSLSLTATTIQSSVFELSNSGGQLSSQASTMAASLEETVASLEELSSIVAQNANSAAEAADLSIQCQTTADLGKSTMGQLISAMDNIRESSDEITSMVDLIDDIAFQTNLLALNAAIEAARAGEQGKGFADAVRALAQKSADSSKSIGALIRSNAERSERGAKTAKESSASLNEIFVSAVRVAAINREIASACREQSIGLGQINSAMNDIDQSSQQNASLSEELSTQADEMSNQGGQLKHSLDALRQLVDGDYFNGKSNVPQTAEVQTETQQEARIDRAA